MDLVFQPNVLVAYVVFALIYLGILVVFRSLRDFLGLLLIVTFCITLGLRDVAAMSRDADPVIYATILSYAGDVSAMLGGADYAVFLLLHRLTGSLFDLRTCFLFLHLLFIPVLFVLYRSLRQVNGAFFLMVGWLMFINSGLLLIANFVRQGLSVILFLALLVGICVSEKRLWLKRVCAFALPFLHLASVCLLPGLISCKKRRLVTISTTVLVAACIAVHFAPASFTSQSGYFNSEGEDPQISQLWIKIIAIYGLLAIASLLSRTNADRRTLSTVYLKRAAVGLLLPAGALVLTANAPGIGLRYMYYLFAVAFLYIACVVASRKSEFTYHACAVSFSLFGIVTWTYPTVAVLLKW